MINDSRVDAYIDASAAFAKPVLLHLRNLVHESIPGIEETIKWNFPNFVYNGKIICSMAAFKQHCAFTFWNAKSLSDPKGILETVGKTAMGQLGKIKQLSDLPNEDVLKAYLKEALLKR